MTEPYTPTTDEVREEFVSQGWLPDGSMSGDNDPAAFDRWLALRDARRDREVAAKALRDHRRRVSRFMPAGLVDRATVLADLDDYADRIERGNA